MARRLGELLERIADEHGWQIVATEVMPDHVHLFMHRFGKVWWSASYFAASVGDVSESTVHRYIEYQWDAVAS